MRRFLDKFYCVVEKIGKQNVILLLFVFLIIIVTGLYQTFSLYTESNGISILDGIKTFRFILNEDITENSVTIASGSSKNIAITVTNDDEINLKYGIYYSSSDDLTDVDLGYPFTEENSSIGVLESGKEKIVDIKVYNYSSKDVTITFGTVYGLENGGDLILKEGKHWLEIIYPYKEEVEYIQSNGTQYIDTGIYPNQDTSIEFIAETMQVNDTVAWFGGRDGYSSDSFVFWQLAKDLRFDYENSIILLPELELKQNVVYKLKMDKNDVYVDDVKMDNKVIYVNDVIYDDVTYGSFSSPVSLVLFGIRSFTETGTNQSEGVDTRLSKLKLYGCKIWSNEELIRDFIPVIDRDGIPCLFDKVNHQLYYNDSESTDQFYTNITGNDIASNYIYHLYNDGSVISTAYIGGDSSNPSVSLNANQGIMLDNNGEYRYYGANPKNYVRFNDELWRMISVSNIKTNLDDPIGKLRVKLIRDESIGNYSWDSSASTVNSGYGFNEWRSADLNIELNGLYYNRGTGNCYNGEGDVFTTCDFSNIGLNVDAKSYMEEVLWYLGGAADTKEKYATDFYTLERGTIVYDCSIQDDYCPRNTTWIGNIGLIYPSDYSYATDLSLCTSYPYDWNLDVNADCRTKNWIYESSYIQWFLTPSSSYNHVAFDVVTTGTVGYLGSTSAALGVRPSIYLKDNVRIVDGTGSDTDPYILEIG